MDYTYLRLIYNLLSEYLPLFKDALSDLSSTVDMLLQTAIFFGFLFAAFNFISKRWLTLNA